MATALQRIMYSSSVIGSQPELLSDTTVVPEVSSEAVLVGVPASYGTGVCVNASAEGGIGAITDSAVASAAKTVSDSV